MTRLLAALLTLGLVACASAPKKPPSAAVAVPAKGNAAFVPLPAGTKRSPYAPAREDLSKRGHYQAGGLYAPHIADSTPQYTPDVDAIPEPAVTAEPRSRVGNRSSYTVLGQQYRVLDDASGYVEEGLASYYGNKFHGRRTSNLEVYDMYAFSAAHKSLPLPSFARVTNRDNGKAVIVRVNDRGPFHAGRVIDLSYAAAVKLGITQRGTGRVEVRALTPGVVAAPPSTTLRTGPSTTLRTGPSTTLRTGPSTTLRTGMLARATPSMSPSAVQSMGVSTLDRLVAAIPIAAAAAGERPPGMRIATGQPAPITIAAVATVPTTLAASGLPAAAPTAAPASVNAGSHYRFDMRQDGTAMSAVEFETWMKSRQVRIATGKPVLSVVEGPVLSTGNAGVEGPVLSVVEGPVLSVVEGPVLSVVEGPPVPAQAAAAVVTALASAPRDPGVTLQVASFSTRDNADRALAMLHGAGIDGARLNDASANGQKVWRLRVGPLAAAAAPELAARIVGLGFSQPQRVRD